MTDYAITRWRDREWLGRASGWASDRLAEHGHRMVGEPEQTHVRPWSTLLRMPTRDGVFWFKANAIGTAHEGPLIETLARCAHGHVLRPLAIDVREGWLLLPDGGRTLRVAQGGETDIAHWEEILTDHAELQRNAAPHADELADLGVPDVRPERLPRSGPTCWTTQPPCASAGLTA